MQYDANQTRNTGANPFSFREAHWVILRALHNTRDQRLYVPPDIAQRLFNDDYLFVRGGIRLLFVE